MLIAILSDTHDNALMARAALELVRPRGPAAYVHCGDMCSPEMLDLFAGLPLHFVFGNCDFDPMGLVSKGASLELHCHRHFGEIELGGKKIALLHGDDSARLRAALAGNAYDYVFTGHTHQRHDARRGRTRHINPGALHRAAEKTVALLDLASDALEYCVVSAPYKNSPQ